MNAARAFVLLFTIATVGFAQETKPLPTTITVDGITYSNVTWRTVTPATVSIFHQTGVASIPLKDLPSDIQKRFDYDPQKAADYNSADAATQAQWAERIADAQEAQKIQQLRQALQQQYAAIQSPVPPAAPADQSTPSQIVPLSFTTLEFQAPSNGLSRAILTLTSGGRAFVVYSAEDADTFLKRCAAERAVWRQQEHNLAQSRAAWGFSPFTGFSQMTYTHPTQIYTVYGALLSSSTYKLVGNGMYQQMGGSISYTWR